MGRLRNVVIPLDGSALSEAAVPAVRDLLGADRVAVTLLHVIVPSIDDVPVYPGWGPVGESVGVFPPPTQPSPTDEEVARARAYLAEVRRRLPPDMTVAAEVRIGVAAHVILAVAREARADLIAMATHGRGGIARAVLGSVTDLVLRTSPAPVLVVHPHPGTAPGGTRV